jgi:putative toxin-antitoxin system antitoxin component (TIGR02293 family)
VTVGAVANMLGGKRVFRRELTSELEFIKAVRAGLPARALEEICDELAPTVGQMEIYRAVGSVRTLQRKRAAHAPLSADESDRLARLARLLVRAEEALGDRTRAHQWLSKPSRALGGQRPLSLLDSDTGATAVERELGRIEHGILS